MRKGEASPTSFSAPKTFWLLFLALLLHWCKISRPYLVPVPTYWTWSKTTHHCRKCVTDFWRGAFRAPHPWAAPKRPILNRVKDFFNKCDQIGSFLMIWSHLLKKFLIENFIFCAVYDRAFLWWQLISLAVN